MADAPPRDAATAPDALESPSAAAYAMPEFTRALRGIASPAGLGRPEHASVFGPLLTARRLAERAGSVRARVAAFEPPRLQRAWLESIDTIAAGRVPKAGADRRALTARLAEQAEPVLAAIAALEVAAERVRAAGDTPDERSWHAWIAAVQALFDAVDRFWSASNPSSVRGRRRSARKSVAVRRARSWWR